MKKQVAILVLGVVALVLVAGYSARNFTLAQCEKPNENEELCHDPTSDSDYLVACYATTSSACNGVDYVIDNFPKGTENSDEGRTKGLMLHCYHTIPCEWKAAGYCGFTSDVTNIGLPVPKEKTVAKEDGEIDDGDSCKPGKE